MSDPVTNHDIEDVLSSIRRLVAQGDTRKMEEMGKSSARLTMPTADASTAPVTPENDDVSAKPELIERLVLTPAFRVTPQADAVPAAPAPVAAAEPEPAFDAAVREPESDVIPTKDDRPIPAPAQSPSERASLEATIAELEAAVNSRSDEWEPDGTEEAKPTDFHAVFVNKLDAIRPSRFMRRKTTADEPSADETVKTQVAEATDDVASFETAEALETTSTEAPSTETSLNDAVIDHVAEAVQEELAEAFPHLTAADEDPDQDETFAEASLTPKADTNGHDGLHDVVEEPATTNGVHQIDEADSTVIRLAPESAPQQDHGRVPEDVTATPVAPFTVVPEASEPASMEEVAEAAAAEPEMSVADAATVELTPEAEQPVAREVDVEVAELAETAVVDEPATFRRASSFQEVYDPVAEATADAAEAAEDAGDIYGDELAPDPDAPGTEVTAAAPAGQLMDPDMVRDMVSQMIREELQGEMGERITRNVRKLVRREINRVLSAQEFE